MNQSEVLSLNVDNVFQRINSFLRNTDNERTRVEYERDIRQFFEFMRHRTIEQLTENDIVFNHEQIKTYRSYLIEQYGKHNSTVNRKFSSIRALYKDLAVDDKRIRLEVFNIKAIKTKVASYGVLEWEEAKQMIDIARYESNGLEKSLLLEIASRTSIRVHAITQIKWSDINYKNGYWIVSVYDKGEKLDEKPIPDELYERLTKLNGKNGEYVFGLSVRTCERLVKSLCIKIGIDPSLSGRNITFHSFKKVAVNWILDTSGDIKQATIQANHSDIRTTYESYIDKTKDFGAMAGVTMGMDDDLSVFEKMSKEELLDLIRNSKSAVKVYLINQAKKM